MRCVCRTVVLRSTLMYSQYMQDMYVSFLSFDVNLHGEWVHLRLVPGDLAEFFLGPQWVLRKWPQSLESMHHLHQSKYQRIHLTQNVSSFSVYCLIVFIKQSNLILTFEKSLLLIPLCNLARFKYPIPSLVEIMVIF